MVMLERLNQITFLFIHRFAGRNVIIDDAGIFFSKYLPYLMVAAFLVLAYYEEGWRKKFYLFAEGAIAVMLARGIVTEAIRFFYHHERPFSFYQFTPLIPEGGWSFPSGHVSWFFALSMVVWYANRKWGIAFFVLSSVVGLARIYAGVHWPLDILGGVLVGILSAMLVRALLRPSREALNGPPSFAGAASGPSQ